MKKIPVNTKWYDFVNNCVPKAIRFLINQRNGIQVKVETELTAGKGKPKAVLYLMIWCE